MKKTSIIILPLLSSQIQFSQAQLVTPAVDIIKSWSQHQEVENSSVFKYLPWRSIGPISQGGRVERIVGVSGDSSIIYMGIGSGGVFKSDNGKRR